MAKKKPDLEVRFEDLLLMRDELERHNAQRAPSNTPKLFEQLPAEALTKGFSYGEWRIKPRKFKEQGRTFYGLEFKRKF